MRFVRHRYLVRQLFGDQEPETAELLEEADIHPQVIKEMSTMLDVGSEWISLYGLLMKQIEDTVNCVDLTAKQLQRLYKDKK